jgi:hypothetical protein
MPDEALSTWDTCVTETLTQPQLEAGRPVKPVSGLTPAQKDEVKQTLRADQDLADRYCERRARRDANLPLGVGLPPAAIAPWGTFEQHRSACIDAIQRAMGAVPRSFVIQAVERELESIYFERVAARKRLSKSYHDGMTPTEYEHLCARLLSQAGWKTEVTRASGDQGADVVATKGNTRAVIQAKKYSTPVGNDAVQQVYAAQAHYGATVGAVVCTAGFTASARQLARSTRVHLLHHDQLLELPTRPAEGANVAAPSLPQPAIWHHQNAASVKAPCRTKPASKKQ